MARTDEPDLGLLFFGASQEDFDAMQGCPHHGRAGFTVPATAGVLVCRAPVSGGDDSCGYEIGEEEFGRQLRDAIRRRRGK